MAKKDVIQNIEKEIEKSQTYNPLLKALQENDKNNLFKTNVVTAFHKTGFPLFDYYFGSVVNVHDELGNLIGQEPRIGQAAGTFNLIVGSSGSGKSTFVTQISANIMRQFPFSNIIHYDCENRMDVTRCENITKLPASYFDPNIGERYMIKSGMVGLDTIQEMIVKTYVNKMKLKKELEIKSGIKDEFGKDVIIFQPTIIIIDSITTVINETINPDNAKEAKNAENLRGNTEGARDAKTMKGFLKEVLPMCKEAGILIYGINHINTNMSMNAFTPVARSQINLKVDEVIPGGRSLIFYSFNIVKLNPKPSDNFTEESDGFVGHIVGIEPIKSSVNVSGNNSKGVSFEMVFDFKKGFDSLRSMILYARDNGIIEGNKNRMKFKNDDSFTFSWKTLYEEVKEKPIWENIKKYVIPELEKHLSFIDTNEKFDDRTLDY